MDLNLKYCQKIHISESEKNFYNYQNVKTEVYF